MGEHLGTTGYVAGNLMVQSVFFRTACNTPCTLYVPPGPFNLWTDGKGLRPAITELDIPPGGLSVVMRAPSRARFWGGFTMLLSGTVVALVGGILTSFAPLEQGPSEWARSSLSAAELQQQLADSETRKAGFYGGGAVLIGVAIPLVAGGIAMLVKARTGVAYYGRKRDVAPAPPSPPMRESDD